MKTIMLNAFVTAAVVVSCFLALEAFHTWQRVNSLWAWVGAQEQARQAVRQAPPAPSPAQPEAVKK